MSVNLPRSCLVFGGFFPIKDETAMRILVKTDGLNSDKFNKHLLIMRDVSATGKFWENE